jgi:hypothetical protein
MRSSDRLPGIPIQIAHRRRSLRQHPAIELPLLFFPIQLPAEVDEIRLDLVDIALAEQVIPTRHAARLKYAITNDLLEGSVRCLRRAT